MTPDDLWHLTNPPPDATPCGEHGKLVASKRHGRGKRWRVRYTDPNGDVQTQAFDLKGDAERFELKMRSDVARGEYVDPTAGRMTFRELAERWRANAMHVDSTAQKVESAFRQYVYPALGDRPLRLIRQSDIQGLVRRMSDTLSPGTVDVVCAFVWAVFRTAVTDGIIHRSPCTGVVLPTIQKKRVVPLALEVVEGLRLATSPAFRVLHDLGAMAGLRQGEAFGLEVDHVDFLRRTVRVDQQLKTIIGEPPFLGPPKTAKSRRTIPVGRVLIDRLAAHLAQFPAVPVEIVDKTGPKSITRKARLFSLGRNGQPHRRGVYSRTIWRPAVLSVGLTGPGEPTSHDLRHFFASALIAKGASPTQVQARLGHATIRETMDTYAHLWPDEDDRTRDIIDGLFDTETPRLRRVE
jgi:integrase